MIKHFIITLLRLLQGNDKKVKINLEWGFENIILQVSFFL